MIKKIQRSFSLKIFLLTTAVLALSNLLLLAGVYALVPWLYTSSYNENMKACMTEMGESLPHMPLEEAGDFLSVLCRNYGVRMAVYDCLTSEEAEIPGLEPFMYQETKTSEDTTSLFYNSLEKDGAESLYTYVNSDNLQASVKNLEIQFLSGKIYLQNSGPFEFTLYPQEGNKVHIFLANLRKLLPVFIPMILLLSFAVSAVYSQYITAPVQKLSRAAAAMSEMNWSHSRIIMKRKDEIGSLAESIEETSQKLEQALGQKEKANQLLQEELEKQKRLEREQQEFFAGASHDLKTPVTILKGQLTGMLYQVGIYENREFYLKKALRTTEEMEHRIQQMLEVSRLEREETRAHLESFPLAEIIRECIRFYEDLMTDKGLSLRFLVPEDLLIQGDRKLMKKALENILENAVKYSPKGEYIDIHIQEEEKTWCLYIENTGVWVEEEKLSRLFHAFYRGEASRNKETGGSGLGLYIVKKALELQDLSYKVENTEKGFCFRIWEKKSLFQEIETKNVPALNFLPRL